MNKLNMVNLGFSYNETTYNSKITLIEKIDLEKVNLKIDFLKSFDDEDYYEFEDFENYNGGETSMDDLKGKYAYIDVWATWCGPCKAEIPALKELEKDYHGKNIQFVSMSIDDDRSHKGSWDLARQDWKAMVADKELGGIQIFAPKGWETKFIQEYKIKGIPRFILIDPNGNIVDASAPRPSDPSLRAIFDELMM